MGLCVRHFAANSMRMTKQKSETQLVKGFAMTDCFRDGGTLPTVVGYAECSMLNMPNYGIIIEANCFDTISIVHYQKV